MGVVGGVEMQVEWGDAREVWMRGFKSHNLWDGLGLCVFDDGLL